MDELNDKMTKSVIKMQERLSGLRTNRAHPEMLSQIKVRYYENTLPLNQLASITTPESKLFLLNIFDNNAMQAIEKAILASNLGLNPQVDGTTIKLRLPELTEERRKEMVKVLYNYCEETKVSIRNIRRESLDKLKKQIQNKEVSEDNATSEQNNIQKATDSFITQIDKLKEDKEKALLQK